ncbi:peptidoglycan DD-metalloendopeptidase family protein [Cetobacterium sp. 8H]|uniref:M23 family metallopeptidase n=1 Tax=Cetobacterium sp. 8H TaxID=2759681 RepID=UPI00163C48C5|nr:M23 family metallopeptidase [Cetobacterium sp. 8H]MBC2851125.1 peptidoglycan DD-metalloendopeptidase family protein [Cetobacterium sp. 8H]
MKKEKKIIILLLVFLVTSVFYREIKLNNKKLAEEKILNKTLEEKQEVVQIDVKENINKDIKIDEKIDTKISEISLENKDEDEEIEKQVAKEWENQEQQEKTENEISLEEKINLENMEYVIKKGDTISDLSKEYKIKTDYIYANNVDQNLRVLQIGKKIKIPTEDGIFYSIKKGDTFESLSKKFDVDIKTIKEDNEIDRLLIGAKIFLREPKVSKYLNSFKTEYVKTNTLGKFSNPLVAMKITSGFGTRKHPVLKKVLSHGALDLKAKVGTKVMSARDGVVSYAGRASGYGKLIIIKHSDGYETRYAHLSKIDVKKGQKISQNELIGLSGATGRVSGPHLHFEIRQYGKVKNPLSYLNIK